MTVMVPLTPRPPEIACMASATKPIEPARLLDVIDSVLSHPEVIQVQNVEDTTVSMADRNAASKIENLIDRGALADLESLGGHAFVAFYSSEMSHDACRGLFAIMHANNKAEYPHTPFIEYEAWKAGTLTAEQEDFLFYVADHDLRNNPKLGTLYLNQPNKSKFRLSDFQASLLALETTMPVHCCVVDYLTLMYPLESERGYPQRADYNDLIKGFKNLLITHRDLRGNIAPILGVTAHQISRHGFDACLKAESRYDIAALASWMPAVRAGGSLAELKNSPFS